MRLVPEHINEKFSEDSDPIRDLGIGINLERIKKWMHENTEYSSSYEEYILAICTQYGKKDYIDYLIDYLGHDINERDSLALRVAIFDYKKYNREGNEEEMIEFLINKGASLSEDYIETIKEGHPNKYKLIQKYLK
jgi:deoxyhypusine synthase